MMDYTDYMARLRQYPEDVRTRLDALMEAEDCSDNLRIAEVGDALMELEYDDRAASGCCGMRDDEMVSAENGKTYRVGFNYGH